MCSGSCGTALLHLSPTYRVWFLDTRRTEAGADSPVRDLLVSPLLARQGVALVPLPAAGVRMVGDAAARPPHPPEHQPSINQQQPSVRVEQSSVQASRLSDRINSLYRGLVQDSRDRDPVEALHGGHGRLHGLLLPQVGRAHVVRQQVAVVLQPRLEDNNEGEGDKGDGTSRRRLNQRTRSMVERVPS